MKEGETVLKYCITTTEECLNTHIKMKTLPKLKGRILFCVMNYH